MIMNSCEDTKFITYRSTHPLSTHWSLGSSYSSESVSSSSVSCPLPHRLKAAISCSYDHLYAISKVNLYMCKIKMISASDCLMTSPAWHGYRLQCAKCFFPGGGGVAQGTNGRKRTFGTFFGPQLQCDNCGTWWGTSDFHFFSILFGHLGWQPNENASRHLMTKSLKYLPKEINLLGFKCKSNNIWPYSPGKKSWTQFRKSDQAQRLQQFEDLCSEALGLKALSACMIFASPVHFTLIKESLPWQSESSTKNLEVLL